MANHCVLTVKDLVKTYPAPSKKFPAFTAVKGISFSLQHGEILGLLGPNGAGKTTTIQMLLSTLTPTSGSIEFFGKNFFRHRSETLQKIGFASTYVDLPDNLSVYENLKIHAMLFGLTTTELKHAIEKFLKNFGVWEIRNKTSNTLSAGQKTRVMLAQAFLTNPMLLLLDEPTASLDPDIAYEVRNFILNQQKEQQTSILFTSHNMTEVEEICDRVLVLQEGNIIANDTPQALAASKSTTRIELMVGDGLKRTIAFAEKSNLPIKLKNRWISIEIHEHKIAEFLSGLAKQGVLYTEISIEKPTLEDYFLHIAKQQKTVKGN